MGAGIWRDEGDVSAFERAFRGRLVAPKRRPSRPLERLADGRFDDGAEVAVGNLWAHESPEALELSLELCAGGELHVVPAGGQGLNDGTRVRLDGERLDGERPAERRLVGERVGKGTGRQLRYGDLQRRWDAARYCSTHSGRSFRRGLRLGSSVGSFRRKVAASG